jgi:ribosome recycling factor
MTEEVSLILDLAVERMDKTMEHLDETLLSIRAGKASPNVLKGIMVDYYGTSTPVQQVASVTVPDAKTVLIQPWERNLIPIIEKAIMAANIGLTPSNNGEQIRLTIPTPTEERRRELVKQVRSEAETARVSLRNARREAVDAFKAAQKDGMPEDVAKDGEAEAQKLIDRYNKSVDEAVAAKEKEIMTV